MPDHQPVGFGRLVEQSCAIGECRRAEYGPRSFNQTRLLSEFCDRAQSQGVAHAGSTAARSRSGDCFEKSLDFFIPKNSRKNREAVILDRVLPHQRASPVLAFTRVSGRGFGTTGSFAGVICSIDLPLTWTKLSSRAASSAFTASFTRERATKFPKKVSSSLCSAAMTQSRYFESSAESASGTESPTPSRTASGAQR